MADPTIARLRVEIAQREASVSNSERRIAKAEAETERLRAQSAALVQASLSHTQSVSTGRRHLPFEVREKQHRETPGFDVEFKLPFKRADLWNEIARSQSQQPLGSGVPLSPTRFTLLRPGAGADGIALGAVRETSIRRFGDFVPAHLSRCVAFEPGLGRHANSFISWEQIEGTADLYDDEDEVPPHRAPHKSPSQKAVPGGAAVALGVRPPRVSTLLADDAMATRVTLSYDQGPLADALASYEERAQGGGTTSDARRSAAAAEFEERLGDVARRWYEDISIEDMPHTVLCICCLAYSSSLALSAHSPRTVRLLYSTYLNSTQRTN